MSALPESAPRWMVWELMGDKKTPLNPKTGKQTDAYSTKHCVTRGELPAGAKPGLVLGKLDDGEALMGVDGDTCLDAEGGLTPWAKELVDAWPSYIEISPSKTGVKGYARVSAATFRALQEEFGLDERGKQRQRKKWTIGAGKHPPGIELCLGGYFAVTDHPWNKTSLRKITLEDVKRVIAIGERIARKPSGGDGVEGTGWDDDTGSGASWRLAVETARELGEDGFDDYVAAVEANPEALRSCEESPRGYDKQLERDWRRACEKVAREESRVVDKFKDLGDPREDPDGDRSDDERKRKRAPLRFYTVAGLAGLPEPFDFVRGLLHDGAFSVMFGAPGTGKSFLALDIAAAVSLGRTWARRDTDRRGCLIIALEGLGGLKRRVRAWSLNNRAEPPLTFGLGHLDLRNPEHWAPIIEHAKATGAGFIVVDTLARAMSGGNENAPDDMGALIAGADAIRKATGAHIMLIHHSGKDEARGARGHTSLRGAVDTEIEVTRAGEQRLARVTKAKDGVEGVAIAFTLQPVDTDLTDARGERIKSAVVVETEGFENLEEKMKLSDRERAALEVIRRLDGIADVIGPITRTYLRDSLLKAGWPGREVNDWRGAFRDVLKALEKKSVVRVTGEEIALC